MDKKEAEYDAALDRQQQQQKQHEHAIAVAVASNEEDHAKAVSGAVTQAVTQAVAEAVAKKEKEYAVQQYANTRAKEQSVQDRAIATAVATAVTVAGVAWRDAQHAEAMAAKDSAFASELAMKEQELEALMASALNVEEEAYNTSVNIVDIRSLDGTDRAHDFSPYAKSHATPLPARRARARSAESKSDEHSPCSPWARLRTGLSANRKNEKNIQNGLPLHTSSETNTETVSTNDDDDNEHERASAEQQMSAAVAATEQHYINLCQAKDLALERKQNELVELQQELEELQVRRFKAILCTNFKSVNCVVMLILR